MKKIVDCIPCLVRQASEAIAFCVTDGARRADIMRHVLSELARVEWAAVPPATAQALHRQIRKETGTADPYRSMKESANRIALELLPCLKNAARMEEVPGTAMVRVAVAGNLLDAGSKTGLSEADIRTALCRACRGECIHELARNLFDAAQQARHILYLADNAGEIVLDRALIEMLPVSKMTVGVRGSAVINDATLADAEAAGLPGIVSVIPNGSDAPGTLLDDCSPDFRRVFEESDLIIAKGQGNYESLSDTAKHAFFLMYVTCPLVTAHAGIPVGAMGICERNGVTEKTRTCILQ
jgi:uncharacterized protein with ATP-grasp and redox domains